MICKNMAYVLQNPGFKLGHCPFCAMPFGFSHKGTKFCGDECRIAYNNSLKMHTEYQELVNLSIPLSTAWRLVATDLIREHLSAECVEKIGTYTCLDCIAIDELFTNLNYPPFDGYCSKHRIDILIQILASHNQLK